MAACQVPGVEVLQKTLWWASWNAKNQRFKVTYVVHALHIMYMDAGIWTRLCAAKYNQGDQLVRAMN
eukprot:scaffold35812_cov34-Prasinocladus_malaysianus.AAC.1